MDNIHHITIQVPNIAKGVDWYLDNFGTKVEILKDNNKKTTNNEQK